MSFRPLCLTALYPGTDRGLAADVLAARALGGRALLVCTSLVVAGGGRVTDVLEVPSDTVGAQVEHLLATDRPNALKISIVGQAQSAITALDLLGDANVGPRLLDLTLSGPEGEDLADGAVRDTLVERFAAFDLVTARALDASLVAGMEIDTLEDAQVAVQRLHRRGAKAVLLRLPALPHDDAADASGDGAPLSFRAQLLYDGRDFALFESPDVPGANDLGGASSAFTLALLRGLSTGAALPEAVQSATIFAAEAHRHAATTAPHDAPAYFAAAEALARAERGR